MNKHFFRKHILVSLLIFLIVIVYSCGSYQGSSYYTSDGIYGKISSSENQINQSSNSSKYYKDVFSNIADDYSSVRDSENYLFTDIENYHSSEENTDSSISSQAPWGDRVDKTQIYFTNNLPMHYYYDNYYPYYNYGYGSISGYSPLWRRYRYYDYYMMHRYHGGHPWGLGYYGGYPYDNNYWPYYGRYYMSYNPYNPYNRWSFYYNSPYYYSSFERKYGQYEGLSFANTSRGGRTFATQSRSKEDKDDINNRSEISATINALKTRYNIGRNPSYNNSSVNNRTEEGERNLIRGSRNGSTNNNGIYVPASSRSNINYKEGYNNYNNSRGIRVPRGNNSSVNGSSNNINVRGNSRSSGTNNIRSSSNRTYSSPSRSYNSGGRSTSSSGIKSRGSSGSSSSRGGKKK